jgi:hypothetical protein
MEEQPHERDETILEPYHYICKTPGKDVRGILVDAFQVSKDELHF